MIDTKEIKITPVENTRISEVDFDNVAFGKVFSDHMFVADFDGENWTNLEIKPFANINLHPATSAIHYGQSIFEGLKAFKADNNDVYLFRPLENAKRFATSAERMCMEQVPEDLFMEALTQLIKVDNKWVPKKGQGALYIRPFLFATDDYIGIRPSSTYKFMIFTCPVNAYYSQPVNVKIEKHFTRAPKGGVGSAKAAGNYAASLYPAKLGQEKGFHQLVWTDGVNHEYIEESGTMNIMFKINGKLITPKSSDSILAGITRRSVVDVAKDWGIDVQEREVSVKEVVEALENGTLEEAFGLGTAATVARIAKIGNDDKLYELPAITDNDFSVKVKAYLNDLKHGEVEDKFNWMHRI